MGGLQRNSANRKSINLRAYQIRWISDPSPNVAICRFAMCGTSRFNDLPICGVRSPFFFPTSVDLLTKNPCNILKLFEIDSPFLFCSVAN
jgi:hypothetical protein